MYTMCNSTTFALRHTQISLSGILRHFRPPSHHLLLHTHDTNMEFLQLSGPLLDIFFLFFSKTKFFTPTHVFQCGLCVDSSSADVWWWWFQCGLRVDSSSADVWWLCFSVACVDSNSAGVWWLFFSVACVLTVAVLMCGGCVSV